jgi:hypothetical protein
MRAWTWVGCRSTCARFLATRPSAVDIHQIRRNGRNNVKICIEKCCVQDTCDNGSQSSSSVAVNMQCHQLHAQFQVVA